MMHCAMEERADVAWGGCGDDATTQRQSSDAGGRRGRGLARAQLKRCPTSKKGLTRGTRELRLAAMVAEGRDYLILITLIRG